MTQSNTWMTGQQNTLGKCNSDSGRFKSEMPFFLISCRFIQCFSKVFLWILVSFARYDVRACRFSEIFLLIWTEYLSGLVGSKKYGAHPTTTDKEPTRFPTSFQYNHPQRMFDNIKTCRFWGQKPLKIRQKTYKKLDSCWCLLQPAMSLKTGILCGVGNRPLKH